MKSENIDEIMKAKRIRVRKKVAKLINVIIHTILILGVSAFAGYGFILFVKFSKLNLLFSYMLAGGIMVILDDYYSDDN